MKWLISTIIGVLVLVLGISFARAQRAASLASQADANAQVATALAAQSAAKAKSDDALGAPENSAIKADSQSDDESHVQIVKIQNRDAASLAELVKRMWPKLHDRIYADPNNNF